MDDRRDTGLRGDDSRPEAVGEDAAIFSVARVGGGTARGPAVAAAVVTLAVAGLALGPALLAEPPRAPAPEAAVPEVRAEPSRIPDVPAVAPVAPAASGAPQVLALRTRAWGSYVYVQGEVFDLDTEVVVVSIWSPDDAVLQVRTVSMPGGSTAFRIGPNDRFQLAFEVTGLAAREVAYVHANAYNRIGMPIASARQGLVPAVDPGWWRGEGS